MFAMLKIRVKLTSAFSKSSGFAVHTITTKQRFQILHSEERFHIYSFSVDENAGYVWTKPVSLEIFLRFQIYPDTCGRDLSDLSPVLIWNQCISKCSADFCGFPGLWVRYNVVISLWPLVIVLCCCIVALPPYLPYCEKVLGHPIFCLYKTSHIYLKIEPIMYNETCTCDWANRYLQLTTLKWILQTGVRL